MILLHYNFDLHKLSDMAFVQNQFITKSDTQDQYIRKNLHSNNNQKLYPLHQEFTSTLV